MNMLKSIRLVCLAAFCAAFGWSAAAAQSTNQNFPTPVTGSEISGTIRARDVGDARLTSYFYAFNGNQGDVFINVVTKNLDGDIDVFTAEGLRPLTKIVVYSDNSDSETGRVVYLRQPQRLILRVEGRTPDDNPASFRIKFAGSFAPLTNVAETEESKQPEVKTSDDSDVRVNSVGTIIEVKPKPTPTPRATVARREAPPRRRDEPNRETVAPSRTTDAQERRTETDAKEDPAPERENPPATDSNAAEKTEAGKETKEKSEAKKPLTETRRETEAPTVAGDAAPRKAPKTPRPKKPEPAPKTETETAGSKRSPTDRPAPVEPALLENIRLVVLFKDGTKIERAMSGILRFGVDKGILTIIFKDGSIARYSILDVAKMTVE